MRNPDDKYDALIYVNGNLIGKAQTIKTDKIEYIGVPFIPSFDLAVYKLPKNFRFSKKKRIRKKQEKKFISAIYKGCEIIKMN